MRTNPLQMCSQLDCLNSACCMYEHTDQCTLLDLHLLSNQGHKFLPAGKRRLRFHCCSRAGHTGTSSCDPEGLQSLDYNTTTLPQKQEAKKKRRNAINLMMNAETETLNYPIFSSQFPVVRFLKSNVSEFLT